METVVTLDNSERCTLVKLKVKDGTLLNNGTVLCLYQVENQPSLLKMRASAVGTVECILVKEGEIVLPGAAIMKIKGCSHPVLMKDMCAECGADLREDHGIAGDLKSHASASVAMVHSVPELIVSEKYAVALGKADEERLLKCRKLVLLVDLDETILHTTNDTVPNNLKDVFHFQLWHGQSHLWYHTKFRPNTEKFLNKISKLYELHIVTFGTRIYAHNMARYLDPEGKYFSHRILSRDECFDARSKTANLKSLFPCGESMVCIIDDREEVWSFTPNMIRVKPYIFFDGTADINAPPGMDKPGKADLADKTVRPSRKVKVIKIPKSQVTTKSEEDINDEKTKNDKKKCDGIQASGNIEEKDDVGEVEAVEVDSECIVDVAGDKCINVCDATESSVEKSGIDLLQEVPSKNVDEEESVDEENTDSNCDPSSSAELETLELDTDKRMSSNNNVKDSETERSDTLEHKNETLAVDSSNTNNQNEIEYEEIIEWEDNDDYLMYLEDILTRIHQVYFDMHDTQRKKSSQTKEEGPTLKKIIPYVKKKVLKGVNIVFSCVVPTNQTLEKSRAYAVAKSLGANIQTDIKTNQANGGNTTHLVAAKHGTEKVRSVMKQKGIHIVRPEWLWTCNDRWEHVEESLFLLDENYQVKAVQSKPLSKLEKDHNKRKTQQPVDEYEKNNTVVKKAKLEDKSIHGTEKPHYENGDEENKNSVKNSTTSIHDNCEDNQPSSSSSKKRRFSETINPLYTFSHQDFEDMDKEVDECLSDNSTDSKESAQVKNNTIKVIVENEEYLSSESDSDKAEQELRRKVLSGSNDTSSEDSMSADCPRGWKRKKSPNRHYDDNSHLLEIEDPGEANLALLKAAQSSPHWLFDETSSDEESADESVGSVDDEMAAAVEKELFR